MTYTDLYLRQSLSSSVPEHAGGCVSPDIIPCGTTAVTQPDIFIKNYDVDPGVNLVLGDKNYLYVRTKNASLQEKKLGRIYLGAAEACFLLWPDMLKLINNESGKPYYELTVESGAVGVSQKAFTYTPVNAGDYLAAYTTTRDHPMQLPHLISVIKLKDFLNKYPAFAQRNRFADPSGTGEYTYTGRYDHREESARMMFSLDCINCPAGWEVGLLPDKPDDPIKINVTRVVQPTFSFISDAILPPGFSMTLQFIVNRHGVPPQNNTRVRIMVYLLDETTSPPERTPLGGHELHV